MLNCSKRLLKICHLPRAFSDEFFNLRSDWYPMELAPQKAAADYIGMSEQVMRELVSLCGSRGRANELLEEIATHYKYTQSQLSKLDSKFAGRKNTPQYSSERNSILSHAKSQLSSIIERYAPHSTDKTKELVVAASFAAVALALPLTAAASLLVTATSLIAIGTGYFASFSVLRSWPALVSKSRIHEAFERGAIVSRASMQKTVPKKAVAKGKK